MDIYRGEFIERCKANALVVEKFLVKVDENDNRIFTIQLINHDFFVPGSSEHTTLETKLQKRNAHKALMGTLIVSRNENGELTNISQNGKYLGFEYSTDGLSVNVTLENNSTHTFLIDELFIYANVGKEDSNEFKDDLVEEKKE